MAIQTATNPETGERFALVGDAWTPLKTATNPTTGEQFGLIDNEWVSIGKTAPKTSAAEPTASATNVAGKPILAPAEPAPQTQAPVAPGATRGFDVGAMPEQFKSGVAGMQQSWFVNAAKNASANLEVMNRIDRGETVPDAQDPTGYQHMEPEDRAKVRAQFEALVPKNVAKAVGYAAEKQEYIKNPNAEAMIKAANKKDWGSAWKAFSSDPAGVIQQLTVESAPNMLPSLAGGAAGVLLRGGVPALMAGLGTGSFPVEYMASLVDSLQDAGVDLKDAKAVEAKIRDPKFLEEAGKKAVTRGTVVAAADAASGKMLVPLRAGQLGKNLGRGAANIGVETGTEMGGEIAAQIASGEKEIKWGDVLAEGLGAGPQAVAQTALSTVGAQREAAKAKEPPPPAATRTEPELDEAALLRGEVPKTVQAEEADEIEAITQDLIEQNIPSDNARRIAVKRVAQARKERIRDLIAEKSSDEVDQRAKEYIDAGMDPVQAINKAREDIVNEREADALAQADVPGEENVGPAITPAGGVSAPVVGQPSTVTAPEGAGAPVTDGMVPAGPNVTDVVEGKGEQPGALSPEVTPAPEITPVKTVYEVQTEIRALEEAQAKLLTKTGRVPAVNSKARAKWDALSEQIEQKKTEWAAADKAERQAVTSQPSTEPTTAPEGAASAQPIEEPTTPVGETTVPSTTAGIVETRPAAADTASLTEEQPAAADAAPLTEEQPAAADAAPLTEEQPATEATASVAGEQPKGKRGRPKAALTPEEQQTKEATTKATNAANARERRAIERLDSALTDANLPVDETDIETPEALETAKAEKRAQKVQAVRALFDAAKKHGNSALGNKAKAILADRSRISQQEYDNLKAGWQATQASRQARVAASTENINTGVKGTMTAAEVLTQVMKTGTPFQKKLAGLLRKMVVGINVHVVEEGDPVPARLQGDENWDRARGVYLRADETGPREVYLRGASAGADNGVNNITILHELLHAALNRKVWGGLFGAELAPDAKLTKFVNELNNLMVDVANSYNKGVADGTVSQRLMDLVESTAVFDPDTGETGFEIFELPHEFLSYGMTEPELQNFMRALPGKRNAFSRFVQSILKYIGLAESDSNALADLISVTEDISKAPIPEFRSTEEGEASYARKKKKAEKVEPPEEPIGTATVIPSNEDEFGNPIRSAKTLARDAQVAKEKVRASREGEVLPAIEGMFKARKEGEVLNFLQGLVRSNWQNMSHSAVDKLVRLPTMTFLANWSGIKAIADADTQMQRMVGMANSLTASAYDVRRMLAKELNPFFRSAKDFRTKFENLVYETTIARYDPSNPKNKVRNKQLDAMWAGIGEKGRRMYKGLQKHYENLIDLYSDLLDQQIENLQGMDPEAKKNLMAMLRAKFETSARIMPYFPLVRYGDYWLRVSKGEFKGFYMFESVGDRNAFRQQLADDMREDSDNSTIFESGDTVRGLRVKTQANSDMLKGVFDAIDKEDFGEGGPDAKEALKDAIYQIYLNTMPEQSFRDMFIHRKDRTGFSTDVLRNVSASASKMSMQLARLKYAPMLRNSVSGAYAAVEGNSNMSPFAKETERRVNLALSGNTQEDLGDMVAGVANKASYFWYLSSAASALIQPASVYIAALPVIGANHGDMTGAAKELGKMVTLLNQYSVVKKHPDGTTSIVAPSLTNSSSLSDLEKDAVRQMFQRGVSQSTYTSLVWGYKNLPTREASTVLGKAKELGKEAGGLLVGALMHNTERLTREATFLASYRLGFKQNTKRGMTPNEAHEAAINQAVSDVNEALANYDVSNRPRYMQHGIGKILFQFKMFPLHTALLLMTNFFKMLPLLNKEGKAEAAKKFFGIYLTAGSIAGIAGIPAFSPIVGALAYAFKHMQDDDDAPEELKDKDPETWFRTVFLPDLLGDVTIGGKSLAEIADAGPLNAMTGLAISERIGLNDLFGRDTKEAKTSRESLSGWALEKAGPSVSLALSVADAYDAYQLGDFDKVADKLSPAVLRNLIVAERMAKEGVKDSKGNVIIPPDEAKGYVMAQRIGFRPAELARIGEANFKLTAVEQRTVNERNTLMGRLKVQARKMSDEGADKIEKIVETEVSRFNSKNPEYALMPDDIVDSLVKDLENRASARLGFLVTEKNARMADPTLYRMEQRLERLRASKAPK